MIRFMDARSILNIETTKNGIDYSKKLLSDFTGTQLDGLDNCYLVDDVSSVVKNAYVLGEDNYNINVYIYPLVKFVSRGDIDPDTEIINIECEILDLTNTDNYGISNKYINLEISTEVAYGNDVGGIGYIPDPAFLEDDSGDCLTWIYDKTNNVDYDYNNNTTPGNRLFDNNFPPVMCDIIDNIINALIPSRSDIFN